MVRADRYGRFAGAKAPDELPGPSTMKSRRDVSGRQDAMAGEAGIQAIVGGWLGQGDAPTDDDGDSDGRENRDEDPEAHRTSDLA